MKHRSVIGPLFVIGLGVLLLVNNLRPDLPLFDLFFEYWPVLLIAWGGLRLLEITVAAIRSQPLPRAGISGGEWVLVVLICLFGAGSHLARTHWPQGQLTMHGIEIFGGDYDFPVSASQPAGEAPRVLIDNLRGNVRVVGTETNEVKVQGRTTIRAFDHASASKANRKCPLSVVSENGQVIVKTNHDRVNGTWKVTSDLDISVPKGASVEATGRSGDVDVSNIAGDVTVESDRAGVRLTQIGGDAHLNLRRSDLVRIVGLKGSVDLKARGQDVELDHIGGRVIINGSYSGELTLRNLAQPVEFNSRRSEFHVERIPGEVRIALDNLTGNHLVGPIHLKTTSRDVRLTDFTGALGIELDRGDVELRPGHKIVPRINVRVRSGNIELAVPDAAEFGLWAKTSNGNIENDYGPSLKLGASGGRGATISGPRGKKVTINLETGRGKVVIRKVTGLPGNPAPSRLKTAPATLRVEQH